ncbi:FliH/SctL family protein [Marinomonas sp. C2222]|uniref:Flagellar assembly protein FliH n=1 Tax=Marinomonas sargassi TaxID=2984494 RepID=A0ABT2YNC9_9GAMM|nr:FliH/SctL family protein [Marinomonas sargassi]MCV2401395.1 FliH/SctL family protein [Marinomonas sargassi]
MSADNSDKDVRKLTAYERWELPHLDGGEAVVDSGPAILVRKETVVTSEEVDQESLVYEPLTASQLEEIRSAAYDEGFIQGEKEGHERGYADGSLKGEAEGFEKGHLEGYEAGLEKGLLEAKEDAKVKLEAIETLLQSAVSEIVSPLENSRAAVEAILYESMTRMVENICLTSMTQEASQELKSQLTRVFEEIGEYEGSIKIRLNSDDVAVLSELDVISRLNLKVETDDLLVKGSFVLDSKSFHIDGRIEQRLAAVFDEIRNLPASESGE